MTLVEIYPQEVKIEETGNVAQDLLAELKQFYKKSDPNLPGDWNFVLKGENVSSGLTPKVEQVLTLIGGTYGNVKSAYIYGYFPTSLEKCSAEGPNCYKNLKLGQYCNTGTNSRPTRSAEEIAKGWLEGYEVALLYLKETGTYYWVKIPAKLVVTYECPPKVSSVMVTAKENTVAVEVVLNPGYATDIKPHATVRYMTNQKTPATAVVNFEPISVQLPAPCNTVVVRGTATLVEPPAEGTAVQVEGVVAFDRPDDLPGGTAQFTAQTVIPASQQEGAIPREYLYIGGAIILLLLLSRRH